MFGTIETASDSQSARQFKPTPPQGIVKKDDRVITVAVEVDAQNDFANPNGSLFVPANESVRANIERLNRTTRYKIASADSHAFDSWEFKENGGPFPAHCVKGTDGWLKIPEAQRAKTRYVPMSQGNLVIGENKPGSGNRKYGPAEFAEEVMSGVEGVFEKEVYSMFANPNAKEYIRALAERIMVTEKVELNQILFAVYGYCTGGYCVDAAAAGLQQEGYNTAIILDATAPLNISQTGLPQDGAKVTTEFAKIDNIKVINTSFLLTL